MPTETWLKKADYLKQLMTDINKNHGTINCGRVSLRLDEHISAGKHSGLPSVSTQSADIYTAPVFKTSEGRKIRLIRSFTQNATVLERCTSPSSSKSPTERHDLTDESREVIELDIEADIASSSDSTQDKIKLKQTNAEQIIADLRLLPKRQRDGTAYGFLFYTWATKNMAHMTNFFVDADNEVYFLDAQRRDVSTWVSPLPASGYRPELFYLQSIPPEGFKIKNEHEESYMLHTFESIQLLSEEKKNELVDKAEKLALRTEMNPDAKLNPEEFNELSAAATILFYQKNEPALNLKIVKWAKISADGNDNNGRVILGKAYADRIPHASSQEKDKNDKEAFKMFTQAISVNPKHAKALYSLAIMFQQGRGTPTQDKTTNDKEAFKLLTQAIVTNPKDAAILSNLAFMFAQGRGTPTQDKTTNDKEAFKLFTQAIVTNPKDAASLSNLAFMFAQGRGTPTQDKTTNDKEAFKLFTQAIAANPKNAKALNNLAGMFQQGRGTPTQNKTTNDKEAFKLSTQAIAANPKNADALYSLAFMFENSRGTPTQNKIANNNSAIECYKKILEIYPGNISIQEKLKKLLQIPSNTSNSSGNQNLQTLSLYSQKPASSNPAAAAASSSQPMTDIKDDVIASLKQTIKAQEQTIQTQQALINQFQASKKRKEPSEIEEKRQDEHEEQEETTNKRRKP